MAHDRAFGDKCVASQTLSSGGSTMNTYVRKAVIRGALLVALVPSAGGLAGATNGFSLVSHDAGRATAVRADDNAGTAVTVTDTKGKATEPAEAAKPAEA